MYPPPRHLPAPPHMHLHFPPHRHPPGPPSERFRPPDGLIPGYGPTHLPPHGYAVNGRHNCIVIQSLSADILWIHMAPPTCPLVDTTRTTTVPCHIVSGMEVCGHRHHGDPFLGVPLPRERDTNVGNTTKEQFPGPQNPVQSHHIITSITGR